MQLMAETTVFDDEKLNSDMQGVKQYFWHVEEGDDVGTHITEIPQDEFVVTPSGYNFLATSRGLAIRDALDELSQFTADYVQIGTSADNNVYIDDVSVNIRNSSTVVASFDEDDIYLGKNSVNSVIHFCDNSATLSYDSSSHYMTLDSGLSSFYKGSLLLGTYEYPQCSMYALSEMNGAMASCKAKSNSTSGDVDYFLVNVYDNDDENNEKRATFTVYTSYIYASVSTNGTIQNSMLLNSATTTFLKDVYAPNFVQSSDRNLKDNIKPLDNNIIYDLQPVDFTWKDSIDTKRHYGFIAQDVLKLTGNDYGLVKGDEYLGISYSEIIPLCVDAIQSHKKVIDSLVKELKELKGEK